MLYVLMYLAGAACGALVAAVASMKNSAHLRAEIKVLEAYREYVEQATSVLKTIPPLAALPTYPINADPKKLRN